jgi:peptidoglycan/LPS O-acetylase OafA/YrhL
VLNSAKKMTNKIPSLNGLRAISIFAVLITHVQLVSFKMPNGPGGQLGVNIFFVISGFLITLLLLKEENSTGTISLRNFFIRRSLRIFPVFFFLLLIYFLLQLAGILDISTKAWLSSVTYTKYFFLRGENKQDLVTMHFWSLSVEEHFYLIWPVIFLYLKEKRKLFALAVIIVVPLVRLLSDVSVMHLFTRADALMWGCLFAMYNEKITEFITTKSVTVLLLAFVVLALCLLSKKFSHTETGDFKNHFVPAFLGSFGAITNICIGVIVIISITFRNNIYFAFLNSRFMNYAGILSYSIYMWQQLFFSESISPLSNFPLNLFLILIVSAASYNFIEKPFLKLKDRFTKTQSAGKGFKNP